MTLFILNSFFFKLYCIQAVFLDQGIQERRNQVELLAFQAELCCKSEHNLHC